MADVISYLLKTSKRGEICNTVNKRSKTVPGKTTRNAHDRLLADTEIVIAIGNA
jgi:hypothetical protein